MIFLVSCIAFCFSWQSSELFVLRNVTDAVMFSSLHVFLFYSFQNFSFTALYKLAQHCLRSFNRRTYESYGNLLSVHAFLLTTNVLLPTRCF